ncbi:hypothetical protein LMG3458_04008 [Achromobacter deleyi]|uniref:DUF4189 domain-containing protein n=2 Tax=Pseudomonadota TaxID=1224 RepID=A0A6S7AIV4_9BURK|nr:DUF4189 domain-containing protein [Achromobacter deleyi]CAB3721555.1 hypothetical protein LMG3458_04008 [Achromobacter deleyi]CAB3894028.1 hypothetical protein LMG3482_03950 [Achromobacter deleyi]CAB3917512.1 hypothetical protein LMG3481_05127 [Achromobacter deleyi]
MMLARFVPMIRSAIAAFALMAGVFAPAAHADTLYGGIATDGKHAKIYWALPEDTGKEAEAAGVAECRRAGGKDCKSLSWFSDSCMVYARNLTSNDLFPGNSVSPELAAKKAMRRCTAGSPDGKCRLATMPLCVGPGYSAQDLQAPKTATPAQLEALSAKLNDREYWGAIAESNSGGLSYADGYPNEKDAISKLLEWEDCEGCTKVLTYTDTCVGLAWAKGSKGRGTGFTAQNPDPKAARDAARDVCSSKTGAPNCVAMVRCSGRAYIDGYAGFEEKPN